MRQLRALVGITVLLSLIVTTAGFAKGPRYTDPEKVDTDFSVQGEYVGMFQTKEGKEQFAAQIIALGGGKFQLVGYHGGLPGDGWNGEKKVEVKGELKEGVVSFTDEHGTGTLKDGVLTCKTPEGEQYGKLKKVTRQSETLGAKPPKGAVVLFDGSNTEQWKKGRMTDDGLLMEGTTSIPTFQDHTLHIEFRIPYQPEDRGQGRGNSGLYIQGRYEIQMLDSFGLTGKNNECGGLYSVKDPDVNMAFPPLSWQTYDIEYTAAKFDDEGKMTASPRVTVLHNGVKIHDDVELPGNRSTTAAPSKPGPAPGPIYLQNHGCPVRYRNIWVMPKK